MIYIKSKQFIWLKTMWMIPIWSEMIVLKSYSKIEYVFFWMNQLHSVQLDLNVSIHLLYSNHWSIHILLLCYSNYQNITTKNKFYYKSCSSPIQILFLICALRFIIYVWAIFKTYFFHKFDSERVFIQKIYFHFKLQKNVLKMFQNVNYIFETKFGHGFLQTVI